MLVLLILAGCKDSKNTGDDTEISSEIEVEEDTGNTSDIKDNASDEQAYTSDAYEYQQLESILRKLKKATE